MSSSEFQCKAWIKELTTKAAPSRGAPKGCRRSSKALPSRALLIVFAPVGKLRERVIERDFRGFLWLLLVVAPLLIFSLIRPAVLLAILTAIRPALLPWLRRLFARLFAGAAGVGLHRQGDLVLFQVHFEHSHRDAVAGADHVARVFDESVAEPRDVDESVLMHADVDEGAEVGHVCDDARTGHSGLQVFDLVNVFAVGEGRELFARVAARFCEFGDYVRVREVARSEERRVGKECR